MNRRELELLAAFVHGALAALHGLGLVFNLRRGNKMDASIHGLVFVYDGMCTVRHMVRYRNEEVQSPGSPIGIG